MRITNNMISNSYMRDVDRNLNNLKTLNEQNTSGKLFRRPSDDPFRVARAMQLHTDTGINAQYNKNIKDTINFLDVTDTALDQATNVLQRVHELLISVGNGTYSKSERLAVKDEINQKIGEFGQIMNSSFDGKYIFSGTRATTKPIKTNNGDIKIDPKDKPFEIDLDKTKIDPAKPVNAWQSAKLTITDSEGKNIDVDFSGLDNKSKIDDIVNKINSQIKASASKDKNNIRVVSNLKDGKLMIINKAGKELDVKGINAPLNFNGGNKINVTKNLSDKNTTLHYNSRGSKILDAVSDKDNELKMMEEKLAVEISQGVVLNYNVTAKEIFEFKDVNGKGTTLMDVFKNITDHLDGDESDVDKIINDDLSDIKLAMNNLLRIRSEVGAKQNRMDSAYDKNTEQNFNLTEILSNTEDVNLTEKSMEIAIAQVVYLASLQTSSRIIQPTLMDYLR